ncbi:MAG: hypothetical protein IJI38_09585, partial [Clostridia bacterium]|nr:hypothetical protein [Clostridia bacterium]
MVSIKQWRIPAMHTENLWLSQFTEHLPEGLSTPLDVARAELEAFPDLHLCLNLQEDMGETWIWEGSGSQETITGGTTGLLYGTYARIFSHLTHDDMPASLQTPAYPLRMLNCWDNLDGSVERGYAGRSLFFEGGRLDYEPERIRNLGRLLASCGVNAICINNVNVIHEAQRLMEDLLPDVAVLAGLLRPFGVRLMLSCDFALPLRHGLSTADPL